jgi:hypothetical protein
VAEDNELSPEQQSLLEDILNNRKNIPFQEYRKNLLDIIRDVKFNQKNIDQDKLAEFWKVFGWVPNIVWKEIVADGVTSIARNIDDVGMAPEGVDLPEPRDDLGMSYQQYINMISYSLGRNWDSLEPELQDGFNMLYEITPPSDLRLIANAAAEHHDAMIEAVLQGRDPGDIQITFDDANIEILSNYSEEADLARKAYLQKDLRDDLYKEMALEYYDRENAQTLLAKLQNGDIDKKTYLREIDRILSVNNIDPEVFIQTLQGQVIDSGSTAGITAGLAEINENITDNYLRSQALGLTGTDYYGITTPLIQEVYGDGEEPLYEYGLGRQLFANASPDEIMEIQLLLVEAGFLQPFSFVYGVLDDNDGGTIQAIESAMSRFNLNGETITQEDLYSILLTPGATAQNLTVFVKEFFKDTLEDYSYGRDKFEASEASGLNYQSLFKYIKPSPFSVKSTIGAAIEEGLGRPASDYELAAYADYVSKLSYDIQKSNYDINQSNTEALIAAERDRAMLARTGSDYPQQVELEGTIPSDQIGAAIGVEFDEFVRDKYGPMLEGQRSTGLYNNTFANLLTNLGNIGRYIKGR